MKKLAVVILSLIVSVSAFAQTTKTVTNQDLEKFRQKRIESEKQLKEKYAQMGFPSPEELARQNARKRAEFEQYSDELRRQRIQSQNDIIAQANALRAEIASINAQINYLKNQQNPSGVYKGGTVTITGYLPYGGYGGYGGYYGGNRGNRSVLPQIRRLPPNMRTVQEYASMYPSSQSIYNQSIGNVRIGGGRVRGGNRYYRGGTIAPVIVGGTYDTISAGDQLNYLEQTRAGLLAQWQIVEEKARRAGIRLE
jgi:Spy/CpxP family protein refolding chaperone